MKNLDFEKFAVANHLFSIKDVEKKPFTGHCPQGRDISPAYPNTGYLSFIYPTHNV